MNKLIIITVSICASIILGVLVIFPEYNILNILRSDIVEAEKTKVYHEEYFGDLNKIKAQLEEYGEEIEKIDDSIPDGPDLPSLFNFIQRTASLNGLILSEVGTFSTNKTKEESLLKETILSFSLAGSYPSIKDFLSTVSKSARLIDINQITFSASQEEEASFKFNFSIRFYSY